MVDGPGDGHFAGLRSIDLRMVWQLLSSILIVVGTAFGAFILSCKIHVFVILVSNTDNPQILLPLLALAAEVVDT